MKSNKVERIKIQFSIPKSIYKQLQESNVTGKIDDSLANKIRILIEQYS